MIEDIIKNILKIKEWHQSSFESIKVFNSKIIESLYGKNIPPYLVNSQSLLSLWFLAININSNPNLNWDDAVEYHNFFNSLMINMFHSGKVNADAINFKEMSKYPALYTSVSYSHMKNWSKTTPLRLQNI